MSWLPKTAFGKDLNNILTYTTSKQVTIHDRHLGCLYYSWILLVLCWVAGFQIFYGNNHYQLKDVKGNTRITIQQPTKGCNPNDVDCEDNLTPLTELPYCDKFAGKTVGKAPKHRRKCIYADQHELLPGGMLEGKMFVPTRIDAMKEAKHCTPNRANGYKCKKMWMMKEYDENTYVADIEDYTVMVVSSYYRGDLNGTSTDLQGFYFECRDKGTNKIVATTDCKEDELKVVKIDCLPFLDCGYKAVREPPRSPAFLRTRTRIGQHQLSVSDGNATTEFKPGPVFAIPSGDIFRLGFLLELAGLDLDGSENKNGEPLRERGARVKIMVEYHNLYPWTGETKPGYIFKVVAVPTDEMKTEMYTHNQPGSYPQTRTMENRHGIYLEAEVTGSFGFWNVVFLMVMLTTSLALLATGTTIIDLVADYLPGLQVKKDKYQHIFQEGDKTDTDKGE